MDPDKKFPPSYCMDDLAMALHVVYTTKSYKEAVLKAVNVAVDADTLAAISGMLAGAIYGYQEELQEWYVNYITQWDEQKVALRAYKLYQLSLSKR